MSTRPDARRRLAELMEERRLDLGLLWQGVADAAVAAGFKLSLKTLHSVRAGTAGIRPLTQRAIEAGLQWEHGSIQQIENGGDPVPVSAAPAPAAVAIPIAPEPETPGPSVDADADAVSSAVIRAATPRTERLIWTELRRRLAATPDGTRLFADVTQSRAWPAGSAPVELTPEAIAVLDATPADVLAGHPIDHAAFRLVLYPWPDRVGMAAAMRGRLGRPTGAVRRAG